MSIANAIRIVLVRGWLALFGSQVMRDVQRHALPEAAGRTIRDATPMVAAGPGRSSTWTVPLGPPP